MLEVQQSGPPCLPADVEAFERFLKAKVPADYAEFLLRYNGAIPSAITDTFVSRTELVVSNEITVSQFYTLDQRTLPLLSLRTALEDNAEIVPITSFSIGHDDFGNLVCLDWETGLVSWTFTQAGYDLDLYRNFDLNVSFGEFIASLVAGPYAPAEFCRSSPDKKGLLAKVAGWFRCR